MTRNGIHDDGRPLESTARPIGDQSGLSDSQLGPIWPLVLNAQEEEPFPFCEICRALTDNKVAKCDSCCRTVCENHFLLNGGEDGDNWCSECFKGKDVGEDRDSDARQAFYGDLKQRDWR